MQGLLITLPSTSGLLRYAAPSAWGPALRYAAPSAQAQYTLRQGTLRYAAQDLRPCDVAGNTRYATR